MLFPIGKGSWHLCFFPFSTSSPQIAQMYVFFKLLLSNNYFGFSRMKNRIIGVWFFCFRVNIETYFMFWHIFERSTANHLFFFYWFMTYFTVQCFTSYLFVTLILDFSVKSFGLWVPSVEIPPIPMLKLSRIPSDLSIPRNTNSK